MLALYCMYRNTLYNSRFTKLSLKHNLVWPEYIMKTSGIAECVFLRGAGLMMMMMISDLKEIARELFLNWDSTGHPVWGLYQTACERDATYTSTLPLLLLQPGNSSCRPLSLGRDFYFLKDLWLWGASLINHSMDFPRTSASLFLKRNAASERKYRIWASCCWLMIDRDCSEIPILYIVKKQHIKSSYPFIFL